MTPTMLLTAGLGTRLRPLTLSRAKPCLPLLGIALARWAIEPLRWMSIDRLVLNKHHLPEQIDRLAQQLAEECALQAFVSDETLKILGSGGALGRARELLGDAETLWLANGDEVFLPEQGCGLEPVYHSHREAVRSGRKRIATLAVMANPEVGSKFGGVWAGPTGEVSGFGKSGEGTGWHFIGYQLLGSRIFDYVPRDAEANILYDCLTAAMKDGWEVQAVEVRGIWYETGSFADLEAAATGLLRDLVSASHEQAPSMVWARRMLEGAGYQQRGALWATPETHQAIGSTASLRARGHGLFVAKEAWVPSLREIGGPTVIEASASWQRQTSDMIGRRGGLYI